MHNDSNKQMPAFGYKILREHTLASILGKNESDILYWAGKELAREYPCEDMPAITSFFVEAGWGMLTLEKEKKDGYIFLLINDSDVFNFEKRNFRLEAGFLAQQLQQQKNILTEAFDEKNSKHEEVLLTVKWDNKVRL